MQVAATPTKRQRRVATSPLRSADANEDEDEAEAEAEAEVEEGKNSDIDEAAVCAACGSA